MRLSLITIKRRPDGDDTSRRETVLEGDALRLGRGSDVDINLPDIDIAYHHATLTMEREGPTLSAVGGAVLYVENRAVEAAALSPGTSCRIGPYTLVGEEPPPHADARIAVQKDDAATLPPHGPPQRIGETLWSRRRLSWMAALIILGLFVAWPLSDILQRSAPDPAGISVAGMAAPGKAALAAKEAALRTGIPPNAEQPIPFTPMEKAWISGPMSRAHAGLAENCSACHLRPFEQTTNASCLTCHAEVANHADVAQHPVMALDNHRCAACHKEHVGGESPIEQASAVCTDCHANIEGTSPKTTLKNASDFGIDHPEFRPTLITGITTNAVGERVPMLERRSLDQPYPLVEKSGLKFPHDVHLNADGVRGLGRASGQKWDMNCASCHLPQADGMLMRPIEMERDCGYCHELTFQPENLDVLRELPHAKPGEVSEIVHDYYAARALEGGLTVPGAPPSARRRPGQNEGPLTRPERLEALAFAEAEAERELKSIMEVRLCGDCHVAEAAPAPDSRGRTVWQVQGAILQRNWMPKSRFSHDPHFAMDCADCHAAPSSKSANDVLLPAIGLCRDCHLGEAAGEASASSECLACHGFHIEAYGPMSPDHGDLMRDRRNMAERRAVLRQPGETATK